MSILLRARSKSSLLRPFSSLFRPTLIKPNSISRRHFSSVSPVRKTIPFEGPILNASGFVSPTYFCGQLSESHVGKRVRLCGSVSVIRVHGGFIFFDLRDHTGVVQIRMKSTEVLEEHSISKGLEFKYNIIVDGIVRPRPRNSVNKKINSGFIEVAADHVQFLTTTLEDAKDCVDEEMRPRCFSESVTSSAAHLWLHTDSVSYDPVSSNSQRNRESDFEFLFGKCTKPYILKRLHARITVLGKLQSIFIATRLLNLYAHLGDIRSSRGTFEQIPNKDSYTWNSMVSAYVRNGCFHEAISCVYEMFATSDVRPDFYTFPPVLKACRNLYDGTRLHCWVLKLGFEWDVFVAASLVHMYCRFGLSSVADKIFQDMPYRDMGCWNAVVSGFCQNGNVVEALNVLDKMISEGVMMDPVTVVTILPACVQINDIIRGMSIHLYVIKHGLENDVFVSNALINMYAKFGELKCSQKVFDQMQCRDLISWNSIIAAYEQNNCPEDAIEFFLGMQLNRVDPDSLTLVSLASSFAQTKDIWRGRSVHGYAIRRCWILENILVGNAVVDMYGKLGFIQCACMVFERMPLRDVISWNTIITGYTQNGLASEAVDVYCSMREHGDLTPNHETFVSILPAYAHLGALRDGMRTHGQVLKAGLNLEVFVGTCLIDLYGKCGRLHDAMSLFREVPRTTPVPWNAIISCHGLHGHGETSLQLFGEMVNEDVKPDHVTFLSLLSACSHSGLVDEGKRYFNLMQEDFGIRPNLKHYGCMVDLYGRAGELEKAYNFIETMPLRPDASVWGALLGACRIHGNVDLGRVASNRLFDVDSENVGYYVLLSNIYANSGRWEGVDEVRSLARDRGLRKTPGWSSIELNNRIQVFYTGNQTHPQSEEIYKELGILNAKMKSLGYTPDHSFVLQDVEDDEKENILSSHSERLAIMYGILNTPPKTTIHIFKNLRVCGDCHNVTKFISKITEREIIV